MERASRRSKTRPRQGKARQTEMFSGNSGFRGEDSKAS